MFYDRIALAELELCHEIAKKAHEGQTRKFGDDKGKPYFIHPERVARTIEKQRYFLPAEIYPICLAVAYLHDVIEDTQETVQTLIAKGVPLQVVYCVDRLTKRNGCAYTNYLLRLEDDFVARTVKIADIEDNLQGLDKGSLKDKYLLALMYLRNKANTDS